MCDNMNGFSGCISFSIILNLILLGCLESQPQDEDFDYYRPPDDIIGTYIFSLNLTINTTTNYSLLVPIPIGSEPFGGQQKPLYEGEPIDLIKNLSFSNDEGSLYLQNISGIWYLNISASSNFTLFGVQQNIWHGVHYNNTFGKLSNGTIYFISEDPRQVVLNYYVESDTYISDGDGYIKTTNCTIRNGWNFVEWEIWFNPIRFDLQFVVNEKNN